MAASCSQGALSSFYVEPLASPHTFDSSSERYEFWRAGLRKEGTIIDSDGIRGTRSAAKENIRLGPYQVGGPMTMNFSAGMLDLWLPRILGAAESTNTFAVAETLPVFGCLIGYDSNETVEFKDCMVNQALFHAVAAGPDDEPRLADLTLDIWGLSTADGNSTALPSVAVPTAANFSPFIFSDVVMTVLSAAREVKEWWILVDNHLHRRWVNSLTAARMCPRKRTVMLRARVPYDSNNLDLYDQAIAGAAGTFALTNTGTNSCSFAFANLVAPSEGAVIPGKTELDLTMQFIARSSTTTKEIIVTNVSS